MFVSVAFVLLSMMSCDTVEMINQLNAPGVYCYALSFHGDVVYIGSDECVIQWNVVTDTVTGLERSPGLDLEHFTRLVVHIFVAPISRIDVSPNGSVMVGGSGKVVIGYNTATGTVLWRKEMLGDVWTLRIHGGAVVVPVDNSNTVVLDVTTGHQLHTLPSSGDYATGLCVFDGTRCASIFA